MNQVAKHLSKELDFNYFEVIKLLSDEKLIRDLQINSSTLEGYLFPETYYFFEGVDMEKQHRMQKGFLTFAFGGPNNYTGKGMAAAHKKLVEEKGLDDSHFDAVVEDLGATLVELGVPDDLIAQAAAVAESVRDPILGRGE